MEELLTIVMNIREQVEEQLTLIMDIRGYMQAEGLDKEYPDLFNDTVNLEDKIAELAGDEP